MSGVPAGALRLEIDSEALAANWRALDALSGGAPGAPRAGAAVKADAYGLGAAVVAPVLLEAGCARLFVAHCGEAAALLGHVPAGALAVLHGPRDPAEAAWLQATGVRAVINTALQARHWREAGGGVCDLMVDTGMNRLGLPLRALGEAAGLEVDVLHTHLACADEDSPLNEVQRLRWEEARQAVTHRRAAIANSAGIALGAAFSGDMTRPGLALYGGVPAAGLAGVVRQVVRPRAALLQVRTIAAGDTVGYNGTFVAPRQMRVGTVALGYADGYLRCWSGTGAMRAGEARLPVLGRVSMDMTVIDLSAAEKLGEGDWVEVDYDLPAAAEASGLSQYELLTLLGRRFAR